MKRLCREPIFRWPEAVALALYVLTVALLLPFHEPWGDEVTAWLLSRDSTLHALFGHLLRGEGSPGLWHLLLWCIARLGLPFAVARWVCVALGGAGVYVLLRYSTFPRPIKLLVPFGFFLLYQYVLVARSYVFFPVLVFAITAIVSQPRARPLLLAILLGLLANTSAHGAIYSVAMAIILIWSRARAWDLFPGFLPSAEPLSALKKPGLLLVLFWAAAVATAVPIHTRALKNLQTSRTEPATGVSAFTDVHPGTGTAVRTEPEAVREPPLFSSRMQDFVWTHTHASMGATHRQAVVARVLYGSVVLLSLITFPISTSNLLAALFILTLLVFLWQRRALVLLLPYLGLTVLCMLTQVKEHHTGLLWIALLAALWSAWSLPVHRGKAYQEPVTRGLAATFFVVCVLQAVWSARTARHEIRRPYTGDPAAARFLEQLPVGTVVVSGRGAVAAAPPDYSDHFYIGNANPNKLEDQPELGPRLQTHPNVVVVGDLLVGDQHLHNQWFPLKRVGASELPPADLDDLQRFHYRETHRFCGQSFMRTGYSHQLCQYIYEPER